jgi:leucyl/phenylalanyl-tRNA--protein transferase
MIPFLGPADPFPPVEQALDQPDGLLAAGGSLTTRRLVDAYRRGIFPWFNEGDPILWWSPDPRTVLRPSRIHVSHSLRKKLRKESFLLTIDRVFTRVLDGCAAPRPGDSGTWLSLPMRRAYASLHAAGLAHFDRSVDGRRAGRRHLRGRDRAHVLRRVDVLAPDRRVEDRHDAPGGTARSLGLSAHRLPAGDRSPAVARRRAAAAAGVCCRRRAADGARRPKWAIDADLAGSVEHAPRTLHSGRLP